MKTQLNKISLLTTISGLIISCIAYAIGGGGAGGGSGTGGSSSYDCNGAYTPSVTYPADSGNIYARKGSINFCTVRAGTNFDVYAQAWFFSPGLNGYTFSTISAPDAGCSNTYPEPDKALAGVEAWAGSWFNPSPCVVYQTWSLLPYRLTLSGNGNSYTPVSGYYRSSK